MTEVWISLSTVRLTINRVRVWTMMFIHFSGDAPYITLITGAHVGAGGGS